MTEPIYTLLENIGTDSADNFIVNGDSLEVCRWWKQCGRRPLDLVYIDPPFASGREYRRTISPRVVPGQPQPTTSAHFTTSTRQENESTLSSEDLASKISTPTANTAIAEQQLSRLPSNISRPKKGQTPAWSQLVFSDKQSPQDFLRWLEPNLRAIHELLSDSGSLYLHLDQHISHYAKVMLDDIFGMENFRNEIIWSYKTGGNGKHTFAKKHDAIFFYSKSKDYYFKPQYYRSYQAKRYNYNPKYPELWDEKAQRWYHLAVCRDVWDDISALGTERGVPERLNYPTQKPSALLERILQASCPPGGLVADFFAGSGVCAEVAQRLGCNFLCSDSSPISTATCRNRLCRLGAKFSLYGPQQLVGTLLDSQLSCYVETLPDYTLGQLELLDSCGDVLGLTQLTELNGGNDNAIKEHNTSAKVSSSKAVRLHITSFQPPLQDVTGLRRQKCQVIPYPNITYNGWELIEWISADCSTDSGTWHSDAEITLDERGCVTPSHATASTTSTVPWNGTLICPARPLRVRVRDILGRMWEAEVVKE